MNYITLIAESKSELEQLINDYLATYPPAGYGTMIGEPYEDRGSWMANAKRFSSCD